MPQYNKADLGRTAPQYGFVRDTFEKVLDRYGAYMYQNVHKKTNVAC